MSPKEALMKDAQDKKKKEVSTLANHWQRWSDRDLTTAIWLVQIGRAHV